MGRRSPPTLVSLFTGAGGLDVGLESAGFKCVAALDSEADCVATLEASQKARIPCPSGSHYLEGARIHGKPVEQVKAGELRPPGAGSDWRPDLLAGGPPCQPFSKAGKQESVNDPRGRLFEHFVRLARDLQPRLILFENVRGLVTVRGPKGEPGEALNLVKDAFESIGYGTTFALLNSADFGAPQRRVRLFMMASKTSPLPLFPSPTHAETVNADLFGPVSPWVTLGDYLNTCGPASEEDIVRPSPELAELLKGVPPGSGLKSPGARETTRPGGHWGYKQGTFIADPRKPARTVTAAATQDWIRVKDGSLRRLTWRECAGIQGFPEAWCFVGKRDSKLRQIGNAVPTIFGKVLGESLLKVLGNSGGHSGAVKSEPLPPNFLAAIEYTRREHKRNGDSRRIVRSLVGRVADASLKGLGSAEKNEPGTAQSTRRAQSRRE